VPSETDIFSRTQPQADHPLSNILTLLPHLAAICGWDQTHAGADCPGSDEVRFFKIDGGSLAAVDMETYKNLFYKAVKPSKRADYSCTVAKFKTARDVKTLLASKH